ncbi:MAG: multidrug ABC transporter substrate-binding protein [Deltaproteobacteria bacterium HGW-Deltaproteobacteria-1]|jgi:putative ABC transport system permease protein|nr:MAG: multidrug ABC transporter substrate-binding protein [Deltaproteobacteria bacterium HGW-Deltaproteobacteria-1]
MIGNTLLLALREIRRNVMRSILTILGIVIGVAAVIIMVTIGGGATVQVKQQIASMGSNLLMVTPGKRMGPGQSSGNIPFKQSDAEAIAREVGSLQSVSPVSSKSIKAIFGNQNWSTQVTGTDNSYIMATNRSIKSGRQFTDSEARSGAAVCIVGETVLKKLFGGQDALGEKIRLEKISCEIIGILMGKGQSSMGTDQDDIVVIPLFTFQRRFAGNQDVSMIQISVQDGVSTEKVRKDIEQLLRVRRHISPSDDDNFNVMDMKEIASMLTGTTQMMTALLSAVAAVSLLVGGIGIMNIMLVSVTERTREIGIRLAIGAFEHEVLLQFLVEAVVLSSFGGLIGIVIALVTSVWIAGILRVPFVFNASIVLVAFLFSAAVGVIFGYFPALKAARLDPIEALRHE